MILQVEMRVAQWGHGTLFMVDYIRIDLEEHFRYYRSWEWFQLSPAFVR
jgi:hypothetical protein